jgi:hypothetical protein
MPFLPSLGHDEAERPLPASGSSGLPAGMIETRYQTEIDRLTPQERLARGMAMFDWARQWIGRQILADHGPMSAERLRWEVAMRVYGNEPGTRQLIARALAQVTDDASR